MGISSKVMHTLLTSLAAVYGVFKNGEISKGLWHPRSPYLSCCGYPWGILKGKCTGITLEPPKFFIAKLHVIASVLKIALSCSS
jgi:hypothetical protein